MLTLLLEVLQYWWDSSGVTDLSFFIMKPSWRGIVCKFDRGLILHPLSFPIKISLKFNVRNLYRVTQLRNRSCRLWIPRGWCYIRSKSLINIVEASFTFNLKWSKCLSTGIVQYNPILHLILIGHRHLLSSLPR